MEAISRIEGKRTCRIQHFHFWLLAFVSLLFFSGCSTGLQSNTPLIAEDAGDDFSSGVGFWHVRSSDGTKEFVIEIEDRTSGMIFKDYVYSLSVLAPVKIQVASAFTLRLRNDVQGYSIQSCPNPNPAKAEKAKCTYLIGKWGPTRDSFALFQTTEKNLTSAVAEQLGSEFMISGKKDDFEISDIVVGSKGSLIMELLAQSFNHPEFSPINPITLVRIDREGALALIELDKKREQQLALEAAAAAAKREREAQEAAAKRKREAEMANYGLEICNQSVEDAYLVLGYQDTAGWETQGWYPAKAGECNILMQGMAIAGKTFYLRAEGVRGSSWGDKFNLCLKPGEKFRAVGFNECESRGFKTATFAEIKIPDGQNRFRQELKGGKPSKIDTLAVGDGVYVSGFVSDELAMVVAIDKSQGKVKVRRGRDGTTIWVDPDKVITREESTGRDIGRGVVALGVMFCLFSPESCSGN